MMLLLIGVFSFISGLIIGSFLNVVVLRLNSGESIVRSGSGCFSCGAKLKWFELIPILSFLIQKGRCRRCKSRISWQYPVVEILTGFLFLVIVWKSDFRLEVGLPYYWTIFSLLTAISVYDIRHQIIPNKLVYPFIVLSFLSLFGIRNSEFIRTSGFDIWNFAGRILPGLIFFSFFGFLWLISKGKWMGFGDAKLALGIGWLLGFAQGALALLFSFWTGAFFGLFLIAVLGKSALKSRIPFGPFLALGAFIAFLAGDWFLRQFLFPYYWF